MFLQVSFCPQGGEACLVAGGACMVAGVCVWLLGCMHGCWGGMHGCGGGVVAGACVVVWCIHGCRGAFMVVGGACVVVGGACMAYDEIQSMSGRYASYWNAFLFLKIDMLLTLQYNVN